MSKILGKIEDLEKGSSLNRENLYPLLERGYLLISDHFDIEQCHSIIHQLRTQMRELNHHDERNDQGLSADDNLLEEVRKTAVDELRIFISHL